MYPTKSMLDYMNEINRLFPRTGDHEMLQSSPTPSYSHSLYQSLLARSSSSTDTSPDSFPDMTAHGYADTFQHFDVREHFDQGPKHNVSQRDFTQIPDQFIRQEFNQRPEFERHQHENLNFEHMYDQKPETAQIPFTSQIYETPYIMRRQRPIVGRKIIAPVSQIQKIDEVSNTAWPEDALLSSSTNLEQKHNQNHFYELFPAENRGTEFKTPVNTSPNAYATTSPQMFNMSPRMTASSPSMTNTSPIMRNISPSLINMPPRMTNMPLGIPEMSLSRKTSPGSSSSYSPRYSTPFKEPIVGPGTSFCPNPGPTKMCTFCRKNGETPLVYMTHTVKEKVGNKNVVTCPILRSHVCSTCAATGDNAHTITYCPVLRSTNNGQPLKSTTITLKNTRVKSNGRRRY